MNDGYTLHAFCAATHLHAREAKDLLTSVGFALKPVEPHYTDERPRATSRRNFQRITPEAAAAAIRVLRARQGERLLRRRKRK